MSGWVKTHRQLMKWEWYQESHMVHLFLHLIMSANHEDGSWKGVPVKRGQLITGRKKLSEVTGISQRSVRTCLERLKSTSELTIKTTSKYSVITLLNYDKYQGEDGDSDQQNDQQTDQQATSKRPANDHKQECKEYKESNNTIVGLIFSHWNEQKIIVHKERVKFSPHINARLERYSVDELKEAISNYKTILAGDEFILTHKWTLSEFLTRKGVVDKFLTSNDPFSTYRKKTNGNQSKQQINNEIQAIGRNISEQTGFNPYRILEAGNSGEHANQNGSALPQLGTHPRDAGDCG